jgi:hypothetical protein
MEHSFGLAGIGRGLVARIGRTTRRMCMIPIACGASAQAINLPVDGTFGAGAGCRIVAAHGIANVVAAGGTEDFPESRKTDGEDLIVTPAHAAGPDWVCEPATVDGEYVALQCVSWGATWVPMPVAHFKVSGDTLLLTMPDEATASLHRCRL